MFPDKKDGGKQKSSGTNGGNNGGQIVEQNDPEFAEFGYNTNKTLINFDCYEEEITPQQWVLKYKNT